jgi:hypothetical protein
VAHLLVTVSLRPSPLIVVRWTPNAPHAPDTRRRPFDRSGLDAVVAVAPVSRAASSSLASESPSACHVHCVMPSHLTPLLPRVQITKSWLKPSSATTPSVVDDARRKAATPLVVYDLSVPVDATRVSYSHHLLPPWQRLPRALTPQASCRTAKHHERRLPELTGHAESRHGECCRCRRASAWPRARMPCSRPARPWATRALLKPAAPVLCSWAAGGFGPLWLVSFSFSYSE